MSEDKLQSSSSSGASSLKKSSNNSTTNINKTTDNLSDWIEQRQKSFWDFENSFLQPFATTTDPFQPLRPIFSRPLCDESTFFRPSIKPRAMLASREDPNEEMSPKAKVTYDEDKFQVKKSKSFGLKIIISF